MTQGRYYCDGDEKRVKVVEGNIKVYASIGLDIIYEKDVTANIVSKYFYANGLLIARINPFATTYFHQDALGSTRLTTDGAKLIQFSSNYKPFGPQYGASGTEKVKYVGKWEDNPTKLYYMGARYYDAEIGRFTTQDPLTGLYVTSLT